MKYISLGIAAFLLVSMTSTAEARVCAGLISPSSQTVKWTSQGSNAESHYEGSIGLKTGEFTQKPNPTAKIIRRVLSPSELTALKSGLLTVCLRRPIKDDTRELTGGYSYIEVIDENGTRKKIGYHDIEDSSKTTDSTSVLYPLTEKEWESLTAIWPHK